MLSGLKSPLRYPYDNSKIAHIITKLIPPNTNAITSPFFAGGGLELALINQGLKIYGHYVRAGIFFVINRCTVKGTVTHGSMMKKHPKFNEYSLLMLKNFKTNLLKVFYDESYEDVIDETNELILCCPPEYSSISALNANDAFFPEKQKIDHKKLSERLFQKNKWILFLNHHRDLIEIYKQHNIINIDKFYKETVDEPQYILITNGV